MARGCLTEKIQGIAKEKLGREITTTELRLMVYTQYVMLNEQRIDPRKINQEERELLSLWRKEEHIDGGASGLSITKDFWDTICEILWEGYVVGGSDMLWGDKK
jgi:hypothetical protein